MTQKLGAFPHARGTIFRTHTSRASKVAVVLVDARQQVRARHALARRGSLFEIDLDGVVPGDRYFYELDGRRVGDPHARFLPDGVAGPAVVVAHDFGFRFDHVRRPQREHVIYELHIGAFTTEGTYASAARRLPDLVALGITTIELLPIAAFPGRWGWGYDGVAHFAPYAPYGTPTDLCAFVDEAHRLGLGVLLDVVYNHFGPAGNVLPRYDPHYFTNKHHTPWGIAPNFANAFMRAYAIDSALQWLVDYRFDGLRLDATHDIHDDSEVHILAELSAAAHAHAPGSLLIAEDFRNHPSQNLDLGLDAVWVEDFHHQLHVTLTGERQSYYAPYEPSVATLAEAIENLWLRPGLPRRAGVKRRAEPPAESAVYYLQNHDQVGNRAVGDRLTEIVSPARCRGAAMLVLFLPMIPLLFMGEEWAAATPFAYFTDHEPTLGAKVTAGRRADYHFARGAALDPQAEPTFVASRLDWSERGRPPHAEMYEFYRAMLQLRKTDAVLRSTGRAELRARAEGDVLVVSRGANAERTLVLNLGASAHDLGDVPGRPILWSDPPRSDAKLAPGAAVLFANA